MRDVLVVEDDGVVLAAVARLCRSEDLQVDERDSVDEALVSLAETGYRLALVDLMLPGRSGIDLLKALRDEHPATPVVMISGYATSENALRSLQLGAFDFLPKPFDVAELIGVVRRGLRFAERCRRQGGEVEAAATARRYFLGRHSWATLDVDGTATVGAAESFEGTLGELSRITLRGAGDHVTGGRKLAQLESADEVHRVWSPLSGLILAVNPELGVTADLLDRDPFGSGWLARIVPADAQDELAALTLRRAEEELATEGG